MLAGSALGGAFAAESWRTAFLCACDGIVQLPGILVDSIFTAAGIVTIPAMLIFSIGFVRSEWPRWTVLVITLLMEWNVYSTMSSSSHWLF
jgi:hypothetical protein